MVRIDMRDQRFTFFKPNELTVCVARLRENSIDDRWNFCLEREFRTLVVRFDFIEFNEVSNDKSPHGS